MTMLRELRGQNVSGSAATRKWLFLGFANAVAVDARVKAFGSGPDEVPRYWGGLPIQLPCGIQEEGGGVWTVTATYGPRAGQEAGVDTGDYEEAPSHGDGEEETTPGPELSYSTTGGTQHVTQSIKDVRQKKRAGGGNARDFRQAIGVNPQTGEVAGVDVKSRQTKFSIKLRLPYLAVTGRWLKVEEMSPCVNSATFLGYAAGSLLFDGIASLTNDGTTGDWQLAVDFEVQRNQAEVIVYQNPADPDDHLILDNVHGWSYVWCTYKTLAIVVDGVSRAHVVPDEAFEEQVYPYADLAELLLQKRRKKV